MGSGNTEAICILTQFGVDIKYSWYYVEYCLFSSDDVIATMVECGYDLNMPHGPQQRRHLHSANAANIFMFAQLGARYDLGYIDEKTGLSVTPQRQMLTVYGYQYSPEKRFEKL